MPSALVITDGSLSALVAAAAECDRAVTVVAWVPPSGSGLSEPGFIAPDAGAIVRHQAAVLGYEQVIDHARAALRTDAFSSASTGIETTILLLEAARAAASLGCHRVIWPIALGEDLGTMTWADERAELVNRLLVLDEESGSGRALEISLPYVDLSHAQIDDLAADLAVPRHLCREAAAVAH